MDTNLIKAKDLLKKLAVSRSGLHRLRQIPGFPKPIKLSESHVPCWVIGEIEDWLTRKSKERFM